MNDSVVPSQLSRRTRALPRIETTLDGGGRLFGRFSRQLRQAGETGVAAILFSGDLPLDTLRFVRRFLLGLKGMIVGNVEGVFRAGEREYILLVRPGLAYGEAAFGLDLATMRRELCRARLTYGLKGDAEIQGVFLSNSRNESPGSLLFGAFRELLSGKGKHDGDGLRDEAALEEIIGKELVTPVYQPVIDLGTGEVHGYEALTRMTVSGLFSDTEQLFSRAERFPDLASRLDMLCRRKALLRAGELGITERIFLNVCPALLQREHRKGVTAALLEELGIPRSRITFELTERTVIDDYELFSRILSHYRQQGYSIAIDDLGTGYAGLNMLARLEPEYVKLSRSLIDGIDAAPTRQALVEALVIFCRRTGARVIAEGIERSEERDFLAQAGVHFGQGYLLCPPCEGIIRQRKEGWLSAGGIITQQSEAAPGRD